VSGDEVNALSVGPPERPEGAAPGGKQPRERPSFDVVDPVPGLSRDRLVPLRPRGPSVCKSSRIAVGPRSTPSGRRSRTAGTLGGALVWALWKETVAAVAPEWSRSSGDHQHTGRRAPALHVVAGCVEAICFGRPPPLAVHHEDLRAASLSLTNAIVLAVGRERLLAVGP